MGLASARKLAGALSSSAAAGLGVIAPAPSPPSPGARTAPMDEAAFVFIQRSPHARPRLWGTERNKMQPLQAILRPLHPVFDGEG